METGDDIRIRQSGRVGRITLTRPKVLNALSHDMVMAIERSLDEWSGADAVDLIVIDADCDKAFCAGGDIAHLYERGKVGDSGFGRKFWADEYRMNAKVASSTIPYLAIMDGIVMGGGVGIAAHGTHRVVTERSMVAMPECGIGLIPDVGGTWLLAHAPGYLGEFLGLTGWRMTGPDAVMAGFADGFVDSRYLPALKEELESSARPAVISKFRQNVRAPLSEHIKEINRLFSYETALDCLRSLEAEQSDFAQKAAGMIRKASPLSVACTFEMVRRARHLSSVKEALALEYRFTWRSISDGDFLEGIRAQIIEKDRNPKWSISRLEDVEPAHVQAMLAPLGADELSFEVEEAA